MARLKKGLDFFYFDISFFDDIKIRKLIRYHGAQAVVVYQLVLVRIYTEGYYLVWDDDLPFVVAEVSHLQDDYVKTVIDYCIEIGLFDKHFYESDKILTSKGIQSRFFDFCVVSKRKVAADSPYLLVDLTSKSLRVSKVRNNSESDLFDDNIVPNNSEQSGINSEQLTDEAVIIPNNSEKEGYNSEFSTQSKVKKSKEKHPTGVFSTHTHTHEEPVGRWSGDDAVVYADVDKEVQVLRNSPLWKEQVLMRFKFLNRNESMLDEYLLRWNQEVKISAKTHECLGDAKWHFNNWMVINENKLNDKNNSHNGAGNSNGYRSREDIIIGAARIVSEIRAEGQQPKKELPVV